MPQQKEAISAPEDANNRGETFISVEMSRLKWVIGLHTPLADKIAVH